MSLRWSDMLWSDGQIRISKRWAKGEDGENEDRGLERLCSDASGTGAVSEGMAARRAHPRRSRISSFRHWSRTARCRSNGVDRSCRTICGRGNKRRVVLAKGQRFGLHNLRHSFSNWLVNKGKVEPKTVQGMLRHSDTARRMNLYTQEDSDEKQAAQGAFLSAVGLGSRRVQ